LFCLTFSYRIAKNVLLPASDTRRTINTKKNRFLLASLYPWREERRIVRKMPNIKRETRMHPHKIQFNTPTKYIEKKKNERKR